MATNPMQRKAKNSFLLGFLLMLLIAAIAVGILLLQLIKANQEIEAMNAAKKKVEALNQDVASGVELLPSMFSEVATDAAAIPTDAISSVDIETGSVARINLTKGTILTQNMVTNSEEVYGDSVRLQEYNMLILPSQLETDDYIDVRLRMPTGADYIVVSKKKVEIPIVAGIDSDDSVWLKLTEDEILLMSNAIVESYITNGSLLYVTRYSEPGMQEAATPTYLPNNDVIRLMELNANITDEAKNALFTRNNNTRTVIRDNGIGAVVGSQENAQDNVASGTQEEITKAIEERQKYLEDLAGY